MYGPMKREIEERKADLCFIGGRRGKRGDYFRFGDQAGADDGQEKGVEALKLQPL